MKQQSNKYLVAAMFGFPLFLAACSSGGDGGGGTNPSSDDATAANIQMSIDTTTAVQVMPDEAIENGASIASGASIGGASVLEGVFYATTPAALLNYLKTRYTSSTSYNFWQCRQNLTATQEPPLYFLFNTPTNGYTYWPYWPSVGDPAPQMVPFGYAASDPNSIYIQYVAGARDHITDISFSYYGYYWYGRSETYGIISCRLYGYP